MRECRGGIPGKTRPDAEKTRKILLVGNPNVGKSVLFNALTGAYSTVSNYPGTSVDVITGKAKLRSGPAEIVDTPGIYSLMPITGEERVARRILLENPGALVIHVIDARNLERMLAMTIQLIEAGLFVILVVNILDEAKRLGIRIDLAALERRLGIPVVGAVMKRKEGLRELRKAIDSYERDLAGPFPYSSQVEGDIGQVEELFKGSYTLSRRALALLLLQRDEEIADLVRREEKENYRIIETRVRELAYLRRGTFQLDLSLERKRLVSEIIKDVLVYTKRPGDDLAARISRLTIHPLLGIPLLAAIIYFGIYQFVGVFGAGVLVDLIEGGLFEGIINPWFEKTARLLIPWPLLEELFTGEYGLVTFALRYAFGIILPIVVTFFLFFSVLEDSGYFPRLALLSDRVFKVIGLSGRAVLPLVIGFGCGTMATVVTRTLETRRERIIATLLIALAIPCSAQLGVIVALLAQTKGALIVWAATVALVFLLVGLLTARVLPGREPIFYLEIPPLRLPQLSNILIKTLSRIKWYLLEILPIFLLVSVLMWFGKTIDVFHYLTRGAYFFLRYLDLPEESAVAFILGFFRRDYGAAGLYDLKSQGILDPRQLAVAAVTLTLFVPCVAQFMIMLKERGVMAASAIFLFVTLIAFGVGALANQALIYTGWL